MAQPIYANLRNLRFLLFDVFQIDSLTQYPYFEDHHHEGFEMLLESAFQIADKHLYPYLKEMDRNEPQLVEGKIRVHPKVREMMRAFGEAGWIGAGFPYSHEGQQMPMAMISASNFIFNAANYSASVFPFLGAGAARLILSFGSQHLQNTYIPRILNGEWQGTMALTEPDAGSSLSDITTAAEPTAEGHYLIKGQKIYISCGDHDGTDNIVHLMLAKIKGAPAGVKGISLFVVPQKRLDAQGQLVPNDLQTAGVYHKMGYKGAPIAHLQIGERGDCHGYLVGEPHKGLTYMFQMMNEARIGVGMNAVGIASAAYYASLQYSKERPQGRKIDNKDLSLPQIPIIQHADVKRMLLFQKSIVEGCLSLLLQTSLYADMAHVSEGEAQENYHLLLDLLTPIAKSYPSEMGILSTSAAVQCLGGAGYCKDFPVEQFFRESRIHPIHEGTTGIHGLDLLGRKVTMHNGKAFQLWMAEMQQAIAQAKTHPQLNPAAQQLEEVLQQYVAITQHLVGLASQHGVETFLADATLYLELSGIIAVAWQWLLQATKATQVWTEQKTETTASVVSQGATQTAAAVELDAQFVQGKVQTMRYFFAYELSKTAALLQRLRQVDPITVQMHPDWFE
ncbi:MAG TPA: acyl-CoA dehydrogenase [Microscillaceae bacterium]|nr:acyl-CoA dehydrogenase [Microscillaceae bacterium]